MNILNTQNNKSTPGLKTAGYLAVSILSLLFTNLKTTAQTSDSLITKDTIANSIPDSLQLKHINKEPIKTYKTYEGCLGYKELIALYPSLKDPRVRKANFPNETQPEEEKK